MIDRKFRWEEEWRIKSRMEPWICYLGEEEMKRHLAARAAAKAAPAPPRTFASAPTPPTASPTESPTASRTPSPTESPTASPTDSSDSNTEPEYTPPPEEAAVDEVAQAQSAVSGMPDLGDPTKIPAPAQRTVDPQELVEFRISQMMQSDNPYLQASVTQARQLANQAGLLNTSIAASAGVDAAIRSVLPIAQQDAATLHGQALENQRTVNEFLMQDYMTRNQFKLTEFGYKNTTYNAALQQAHEQNENAIQRNWQTRQNQFDRELTIWRDKFDAASQKLLSSMGFEHDEGMASDSCRQNAHARYSSEVAALVAARETMSDSAYNLKLQALKKLLQQELADCG